jgi:D-xylose reductase
MDVLRYARIEPQALQVELHPYLTQEPLVNFTKLLGIPITAYSSLGPQVRAIQNDAETLHRSRLHS